ncbi:MAG: RNA-processing protein [Thermoplasmata archaeon]|nr:MAG: RNA-processing protein [Thermoplasmata archaeon]
MKFVRIPMERIAVLIGKDGEIKRKIEEHGVKLTIDSKNGEVRIEGEPIAEMDAENVVKAIGRGFSPHHAFYLFNDSYYFILIDMRDYVGKKNKHIHRVAGRIIGKDGKTRKKIENDANVFLSIYGHTIGIIGKIEGMEVAKKAIEMLLEGANHSTVYRYLEREKKRLRLEELMG